MIVIELLGDLKRFGDIPPLDVRSPAEAIRLIADQIPEFRQFLVGTASDAYQVIVDGAAIGFSEDKWQHEPAWTWQNPSSSKKEKILGAMKELEFPVFKKITIQPVVAGASNLAKIILGVALLGVSLLVPGGFLGISAATIGSFGVSLAIGGLIGILQPPPQESKNENSFQFDGGGIPRANQGQPVPVLCGERTITPPVVSLIIDNENIPINFSPVENGPITF